MAMDDGNVMRHLRNDDNLQSWVCHFCGEPFPYDVHPEAIRHHLIWKCERTPEDVKEAAQRIEEEEFSISVEGNYNNNFNAQSEASRNAGRQVEEAECSISVTWEPTTVMPDALEQEVSSVQCSNKRQRSMPDALAIPPEVEVLEVVQEKRKSASLPKCRVGNAFGRNEEKIWSWLMDDQVLRVGIYGMGGVGKTTLMRHIQTRLERQRSFKVYWITVSQDFSISKLQNLVAKKIGVRISHEEDEVERAKIISQAMPAKQKCILILDDLWNYFDVDDVGIQIGVNTCKLVLTTRKLLVCQQMNCSEGNTIQMQPLSKEEAWILFTQELGSYRKEVEELAQAVCRECGGLPLGIKVMARNMKGNCNDYTWRSMLTDLQESKVSKGHEMQEKVFSVLKLSYFSLNDPTLQECLSYCALFPEDVRISRYNVIGCMIVEGIIYERRRQAEFDKGYTMLKALENACLLEGDIQSVWMHDLIRDMVILELRKGSKTLVEVGAQLTELPEVEKWSENLVRVSLMHNDIKVIPSGHTPRCPNLSTLLLSSNYGLKVIADSFFEQFQSLRILDLSLSYEIEKLPMSISNLVNLTALLLHACLKLRYVPSLEKLEKLERLDLSHCGRLKQMPGGVIFLLKLKYLDISGSGIEEIRNGIIPMLSRLQVLKLCCHKYSELSIRIGEVVGLRMLESLHCSFSNVGEFVEYMKSLEMSQQGPTDCCILVRKILGPPPNIPLIRYSRMPGLTIMKISHYELIDPLPLPTDIEVLIIDRCRSPLYKRLFPLSLLASLLNLQEIEIVSMIYIEDIFAMDEGDNREGRAFPFSNYSPRSLPNHSSFNLKKIDIRFCHKLKKLFHPTLLPNFHNLQTIAVVYCLGMEEIFSTEQEEDGPELLFDQPNLSALHLSRLITLHLCNLPELRSIYQGAIICHSLRSITLVKCHKLKSIPFPLPQPSLHKIEIYPKQWWDAVQWGSIDHKKHLESFCVVNEQPSWRVPG